MSGLGEFLEQKRGAIEQRRAWLDSISTYAVPIEASATAEGRSGIRRIRIRDFQIISDSPPNFAGYDLGPTSPELLIGALASCLTHTYLVQAAILQISMEAVSVRVTCLLDMRAGTMLAPDVVRHPYDIAFAAEIRSSVADLAPLSDAVERFCPILNLLRAHSDVRGTIIRV